MAAPTNVTAPSDAPQWNSEPAWKLPGWAEPIIVASILFAAMWFTRRRDFSIFQKQSPRKSYLDEFDSARSSDELLAQDRTAEDDDKEGTRVTTTAYPPKERRWLGFTITTPNSSRFRNRIFSRILQKFPFLIEMFYWIINYAFYRMTSILSQKLFAETGIWEVAQSHGLAVLKAEELGFFHERDVQLWFMNGHQTALTVLNRIYALIHIPGTVGFIAWYYYIAPSHPTFATVRRTMTLTNFMAFSTFVVYPCMPPRLLPAEYGFLDTVRHDDAQSVWMSGKYVNALAAMPSMHFGYAFCIGCTMTYHSGVFRRTLEQGEARKAWPWKLFFLLLGIGYPATILTTIVATGNHYFLDAAVATAYVCVAFLCNRVFFVFVPLEDWLFWALRLDKPKPSTGDRFHELGMKL